jgi:hypothetical protein
MPPLTQDDLIAAERKGISIFEPMSWQKKVMLDTSSVVLLTGGGGGGKALALDTPVLTPSGFVPMADVHIGDIVYDMDGQPVQVIDETGVMYDRPCYEVVFSSGETVICDAEHEWVVGISGIRNGDTLRLVTTRDMYDNFNRGRPYFVPVTQPVNHSEADLPIDPWFLGFMIGDGYMPRLSFSTADQEIVDRISSILPAGSEIKPAGGYNYVINYGASGQKSPRNRITGYVHPTTNSKSGRWTAFAMNPHIYLGQYGSEDEAWEAVYVHNGNRDRFYRDAGNGLKSDLESLGLLECRSADKFIPDIYKYASVEQRLELLRGLMDADGSCQAGRGRSEMTVISERLAWDAHEMMCSLGIKSHIGYKRVTFDGREYDGWRITFTTTMPVFWLPRKGRNLPRNTSSIVERRIIESITPVDSVPVKCISVETGTYLITESHIPTHNSRVSYEKLVAFALRYPRSNVLALRKELNDCERSVIPTLDDHVLAELAKKRKAGEKEQTVTKRVNQRCYICSNGSRIWWGGMRNAAERKAIRSIGAGGSLDFVLMEEAIEFEEEDFDEVRGRMRGRAAPWRQILLVTNPDAPLHWINRRLIVGQEASVYLSMARDNIYLDEEYIGNLETMTGIEGMRLGKGLWVDGTGLVIDTWQNSFSTATGDDNGGNVTLSADYIPNGGRVVCSVDDGYAGQYDKKSKMFTANSHPRVFLLAQIRPTGQVAVFYEDYAIKERYRAQINRLLKTCQKNGWPRPSEFHYDKSSATLRGELEAAGFRQLYPSTSNRDESIKLLKEKVAADGNDFREVIVHPRCHHLILEMSSWSMKDNQPTKIFDHGPDSLRYLIANIDRGFTGEGQVGVNVPEGEAGDRLERKLREIDEIMDRIDSRIGVGI